MFEENTVETTETTPSEVGTTETEQDSYLDIFEKTLNGEEVEVATEDETTEFDHQDLREEKDEPEVEEETTPQTFKLKHNGSEFEVSQDEIIPLAQKGMDYDRIREQRDHLLNDPTLRQLDELAQLQGMDRGNFIGYLMDSFRENQINQLAYQLANERGLDEQTAYDVAALQFDNQNLRNRQEYERQQAEQSYNMQRAQMERQQSQRAQMADSFARLYDAFPELGEKTFDDLPETVKDAIIGGQSPLEAYQSFVLSENKKQLEVMKNNNKNSQRATGSVKGIGSKEKSDLELFERILFGR